MKIDSKLLVVCLLVAIAVRSIISYIQLQGKLVGEGGCSDLVNESPIPYWATSVRDLDAESLADTIPDTIRAPIWIDGNWVLGYSHLTIGDWRDSYGLDYVIMVGTDSTAITICRIEP